MLILEPGSSPPTTVVWGPRGDGPAGPLGEGGGWCECQVRAKDTEQEKLDR